MGKKKKLGSKICWACDFPSLKNGVLCVHHDQEFKEGKTVSCRGFILKKGNGGSVESIQSYRKRVLSVHN
jgi:hypothetical protein